MDRTDPSENDLLLDLRNFTSNFVNGYHPDDGKFDARPITPEYIIHDRDNTLRLFLRISFRVLLKEKICYFPLSFIIDTGAIESFYLSPHSKKYFSGTGRIKKNDDEQEWIVIDHRTESRRQFKAFIRETPAVHLPANIIGLKMLKKLGLYLNDEGWRFNESVSYF